MTWSPPETSTTPAIPVPPPTTPPRRPNRLAPVSVAVVVGIVVSLGVAGALRSGDKPSNGLGVDPVTSSGATDAHVAAILEDAHSGRYFSNDRSDTYEPQFEYGMVRGMLASPSAETLSDEMVACVVSYIETNVSSGDLLADDRAPEKYGADAARACVDLVGPRT
jgi:hypothetical protein